MINSKTNDVKVMKVYAIGGLVIALLLGILSFVAFSEPNAVAGGVDESAVNLSLSEKALDKILSAFGLGEAPTIESNIGAISGPDVQSYMNVNGPFSQGGGLSTVLQTSDTHTLTFAEMNDFNVITFTASTTQAAFTLTLPATTSFPLGTKAGSYRSWVIENPFTAAATTTTIAAGTGVDLQEPDGQNVVIEINNYAWMTCFRETSSDIVCRIDESIPAD